MLTVSIAACGGGNGDSSTPPAVSERSAPIAGTDEPSTPGPENLPADSSDDPTGLPENNQPEAKAGPDQVVDEGSVVILDGRASTDEDSDALSYQWTLSRPADSLATLSDPASATPSFRADLPGSYEAFLVVNDGRLDSEADISLITANPLVLNSPPTADAGSDGLANVAETVSLDGTGSFDPDGDGLGYAWALAAPSGSTAALVDPAIPTPRFAADMAGSYTATLIVNDGQENSAPDSVTISVTAPVANLPPVALAGPDYEGTTETPVTLDGRESFDPDGDPLIYTWSLDRPDGSQSVLSDPSSPLVQFVPDVPGSYFAQLAVNDGMLTSPFDSASITAVPPPEVDPPPGAGGSAPEATQDDPDPISSDPSAASDGPAGDSAPEATQGDSDPISSDSPPAGDDSDPGNVEDPRGNGPDLVHSGSALLSWTPPTEREDGSVLDDLSGYRIYYGRGRSGQEKTIDVENPGLANYMIEDLNPGAWHFAITAVDAEGRESQRSNIASKDVAEQ